MMEEFKKIFLLGIGAASMTYEKSMEIINDMVKKGKLTLEEGKQIGDELRKSMKDKASIISENNKKYLTKEDVLQIIAEYNLISRTEFDLLKEKVAMLEEQIKNIKEIYRGGFLWFTLQEKELKK